MQRSIANILFGIGFVYLVFGGCLGGCLHVASNAAGIADRGFVPGEELPPHPSVQLHQNAKIAFAIALGGFFVFMASGVAVILTNRNGVNPSGPNPDVSPDSE